MSEPEEEIYSTIFTSLKHPIRRRILRMLSEKPMSFSRILDDLGISSSHLTYHLEGLKELVSKTEDGTYRLSAFGDAAVGTMSKVEDNPRTSEKGFSSFPRAYKFALAVCMVTIVVLGGLYYSTYQNQLAQITSLRADNSKLFSSLSELNASYTELFDKYENAQNLLSQILRPNGDAILTNRYVANNSVFETLSLQEGGGTSGRQSSVQYRIYSLVNESELEIQFNADRSIPTGAYVPLSMSLEDPTLAYSENQSFFEFYHHIWTVNATANGTFIVRLPSSGRYILIVGTPQNVPEEAYEKLSDRSKIFTLPFTIAFRTRQQGDYVSFLTSAGQQWTSDWIGFGGGLLTYLPHLSE
jgi:hypothetical protein